MHREEESEDGFRRRRGGSWLGRRDWIQQAKGRSPLLRQERDLLSREGIHIMETKRERDQYARQRRKEDERGKLTVIVIDFCWGEEEQRGEGKRRKHQRKLQEAKEGVICVEVEARRRRCRVDSRGGGGEEQPSEGLGEDELVRNGNFPLHSAE